MRDSEHDTSESQDTLPIELMIWLSPAFPIGGFAYSQGLESAVAEGWVTDSATLGAWGQVTALHGALRNDLILLFSAQDYDLLSTVEGKEGLRTQILVALQGALKDKTGDALINDLYFTGFYVQ